jgi:SAM-dependent methyltransferase
MPHTTAPASTSASASPGSGDELLSRNRRFYDGLWRDAQLVAPERFNTWPVASELATRHARRLEVAPGLRPRLPIAGTTFADISPPALVQLGRHGGHAVHASVTSLPFADASFDLVCAMDIVEHVEDDDSAFAELARVCAPDGTLLLSVPLHMSGWTPFDAVVGHYRRYEPDELSARLAQNGFEPERSAVHGMQPQSSKLLDLGMWFLTHQRERAMWWYNRVFMPIGLRFQKPLSWSEGLVADAGVDTVLVICRRRG